MHARLFVAVALVLGAAGWTRTAAAQGGTPGAASAAPRQQQEVRGRIAHVDEAQREIVLDAGDATTQVKVAKEAKITIDGSAGKFSDLKRGEEVRASLDRTGDELQVVRIEVLRKRK
ncbi:MULTISPECIES: hypothetical protein [unclassified Anaeromyxobacter]|uniref:hypothetical protein n=1 Tax=unclassified Anaeromyxobacter TaxID=2620896 RepID=UPI001F5AB4AD|nr:MULTISPECIES: hypothetical protein [unclassified Anaeromyxobacter]